MQLRPTYQSKQSGDPEGVIARMRAALDTPGAVCRGRVRAGRLEIAVHDAKPPFWAPELRARIYQDGDQTLIRGRFAPKPETWTMFLAIYAATIFSTGISTVFGLAQWQLGSSPWALWALPIGVAAICSVWLGARMGQRLGANDMETIRTFIRHALASGDD